MQVLQRLLGALWLGSAFFLTLASTAAFRAAPDATTAADVVGAILVRWHYIALICPLALFALEVRHARPLVLGLLFAGILFAAAQGMIDVRIRAIRNESITPISELARSNPVRRRFGMLHGVSMLLLISQMIVAAGVVGIGTAHPRMEEKRHEPGTELPAGGM